MKKTLPKAARLTETEPWPEILDPAEMVEKGIYDDSSPTVQGALWLMAGWAAEQLDKGADLVVFRLKLEAIRARTEGLMDCRYRAAES